MCPCRCAHNVTVRILVLRLDRAKTQEFRKRLSAGGDFDDVLEEAFAVVREAAWRVLELRHYDVQVLGILLHSGLCCFCLPLRSCG